MRTDLLHNVDFQTGVIEGAEKSTRRLGDLEGIFADSAAYKTALSEGNPVLYDVYVVYPKQGDDLAYGTTVLMPGQVGDEFYLTKGHRHVKDDACEVYLGLAGEGSLIVRQEAGEAQVLPVRPGMVAFSPSGAVHRLVNTGKEPFITLAVWVASAGHDYEAAKGKLPPYVSTPAGPTFLATD